MEVAMIKDGVESQGGEVMWTHLPFHLQITSPHVSLQGQILNVILHHRRFL